jgi:hypothetical protein
MKLLLLGASALLVVVAGCGGSQRVPKGVSEIDIRAPVRITHHNQKPRIFSRRVTDPSQVARLVAWFDALKPAGGNSNIVCAGGLSADVTFIFRSASGAKLASAFAPPAPAGNCDPIHFDRPGRQEAFLVDGRGKPLIRRVERLLGPGFRPVVGYAG